MVRDEAAIAALVAAHPLPAGVSDVVVNLTQFARVRRVSVKTVQDWIRAGLPVLEAGTNGAAYEIQLSEAWAWIEARKAEEEGARAAAEEAVQQLELKLMGMTEQDPLASFTPEKQARILANQKAWMELARARGELVPAEDVRRTLEEILVQIRVSFEVVPDKIAMDLDLGPEVLERMVEACDAILLKAVQSVETYLAESAPVEGEVERTGQMAMAV